MSSKRLIYRAGDTVTAEQLATTLYCQLVLEESGFSHRESCALLALRWAVENHHYCQDLDGQADAPAACRRWARSHTDHILTMPFEMTSLSYWSDYPRRTP